MPADPNKDLEQYLARIRRTVSESERLVAQAELRIQETDRMLESQGLTREQVMGFQFTPEQRNAVNRELMRRGMEPIADDPQISAQEASDDNYRIPTDADADGGEFDNRRMKFGLMMKPFSI